MNENEKKAQQLQTFLITNQNYLQNIIQNERLQDIINTCLESLTIEDNSMLLETNRYIILSYCNEYFNQEMNQKSYRNNCLMITKDCLSIYYFCFEKIPLFKDLNATILDEIYYSETIEKFSSKNKPTYQIIMNENDYFFIKIINQILAKITKQDLDDDYIDAYMKKIKLI